MGTPKHIIKRIKESPKITYSRKQESRVAQLLKGNVAINSGATLHQNDVIADFCEAECKTTKKDSFILNMVTWDKLESKSDVNKLAIMVVEFSEYKKELVVLNLEDFLWLVEQINSK